MLQNPTWRSLDFGMLPDLLDTSVSCFVVRIWGGQEEQYQLLIEWKVNLDGLRYTGQQVSSRTINNGLKWIPVCAGHIGSYCKSCGEKQFYTHYTLSFHYRV